MTTGRIIGDPKSQRIAKVLKAQAAELKEEGEAEKKSGERKLKRAAQMEEFAREFELDGLTPAQRTHWILAQRGKKD
jgi:hypothetical protein